MHIYAADAVSVVKLCRVQSEKVHGYVSIHDMDAYIFI